MCSSDTHSPMQRYTRLNAGINHIFSNKINLITCLRTVWAHNLTSHQTTIKSQIFQHQRVQLRSSTQRSQYQDPSLLWKGRIWILWGIVYSFYSVLDSWLKLWALLIINNLRNREWSRVLRSAYSMKIVNLNDNESIDWLPPTDGLKLAGSSTIQQLWSLCGNQQDHQDYRYRGTRSRSRRIIFDKLLPIIVVCVSRTV